MSSIWNHYEKIPDKQSSAKCILCKKEYSYKTTTSNLKKHLMYKHLSAYHNLLYPVSNSASITNSANTPENLQRSAIEQVAEGPSSSASQLNFVNPSELQTIPPDLRPTRPQKRKQQQNDITSYIPPRLDHQQKKKIDEKLLEMITLDYQPFSVVEDQGFRNFVKALNPNYELPNRKLISGTLIPGQFMECRTHIMELVQKAQNVCITTDCWTSLVMDSYLSVTAHFMLDFKLYTVLLHCEHFSGSHTAAALAASFKTKAREFKIEDKITLAVSDNAHNIKNAIEITQWPYFGCFLHKLNLVIEKAIGVISFILEIVKKVVVHFKKSNLATEALLKYQTDYEKKTQALRLIQSVPTRWNSVFYMLQRFVKLQSALQAVIPNLKVDLPVISLEVWEAIKQVCMILQPFEEVTRVMSGTQYLTASLAIVIVDGLKNVINLMKDKPIFGVAKLFLGKLEDGLATYFPATEIENNMLLGVCTFLDPRFKIHAFMDHAVAEPALFEATSERTRRAYSIKQHILELITIKIREKQQITANTIGVTHSTPHIPISTIEESEQISIWGKIDKNIAAIAPSFDDVFTKAKNEMGMYLNEQIIRRDSCPLSWWKNHALVYPNLADIFTEHCHVVVTSVECERVFSKAGNILTQKRAGLSRKRTAELVFLNTNSAYLK